jgi:hypothetical protein
MKVSIKYIIAGYAVLIAANALIRDASAIIRDNKGGAACNGAESSLVVQLDCKGGFGPERR